MFLKPFEINQESMVADIVTHDYRTGDVFRKYDISFCCGGKLSVESACKIRNLDVEEILMELKKAIKYNGFKTTPDFDEWGIDFLTDYILHVHHRYLHKALPEANEYVRWFSDGHRKKIPELAELEKIMQRMMKEIPPHMKKEEEVIFPYIKRIYHAWRHHESYAGLLIKTLRKPIEEMMMSEHESVRKHLQRMRELTNQYTPPPNSCLNHKVTFAKLNEMDNDLVQHIHLENNILFPKAIAMEKELLAM